MIRNIFNRNIDSKRAIDEIVSEIKAQGEAPVFTILFISRLHSFAAISERLSEIDGVVAACSTSGELSRNGVADKGIACQVFYGEEFKVQTLSIESLEHFPNENTVEQFSGLKNKIRNTEEEMGIGAKSLGILLVDGLSVKEEILCEFLSDYLEELPLVGGSAGDDLTFTSTLLLENGEFRSNCATLFVMTTTRPFELFKNQHFNSTEEKLVITAANPEKRIVTEINGESAADYYARLLGLEVDDLSPSVFSKHPLLIRIGNEHYVRSIQKVNDDKSFTFFCAIDTGLVLSVGKKGSLHKSNLSLASELRDSLKEIDSTLMFECILRKLEILELPQKERSEIEELYQELNSIGFFTYGEQFGGIHINQTITGVAFGKRL